MKNYQKYEVSLHYQAKAELYRELSPIPYVRHIHSSYQKPFAYQGKYQGMAYPHRMPYK